MVRVCLDGEAKDTISTIKVVELHVELHADDICEPLSEHASGSTGAKQVARVVILKRQLVWPEIEEQREANGI